VEIGAVAGSVKAAGYVVVTIDGRYYPAHRLIWVMLHGEWPNVIDHRNGVRSDNRRENIRAATPRLNAENKREALPNNQVGLLGVFQVSNRKGYRAQITSKGVNHYLGTFESAESAHAAYVSAKRRLHEGCTI
jgi:hypothetical protein